MINRITPALFTVCLAFSAAAQDAEPVEELREFNVEVIVFAYAQDVSVGTEVFVPDELPPIEPVTMEDSLGLGDEELPVILYEQASTDAVTPDDADIPDFVILTKDDLQMQDIADRLRRLDVYDVLLHAGWTQAGRARDESITMPLDTLAPVPEGLSGEFTLYLSRFLHLIADLELDAPGNHTTLPVAIEPPPESAFDRVSRRVGPVHYRIQEDRIFRSGETRYYDHPKFGIVARVTRYEAPEPEDTAALPGSVTPGESD